MYADIAYQAFVRLLMMAFYGSVMIVVVAMARVLLKGAPRWICCMMWAFVAFRLLCPLDLPFGFSVYNIAEHTAAGSFIETISGSYSYAPANIINESSEKDSIGPADENDSNIKAVQNIEDTRKTAETANGAANADTAVPVDNANASAKIASFFLNIRFLLMCSGFCIKQKEAP